MEKIDIIIIGAGIAGAGLAFNLKKELPEMNVMIIDKNEPGANAGYGYRNTTEEVVKEYKLPYEHIYKGIKIGASEKIHFTFEKKFYFLDYKNICNHLIKSSDVEFSKENALDIAGNMLLTDKKRYIFKYLIDCSGYNFFGKKKLKQKIPFRYYIGKTRVLKNKFDNLDYFYYNFSDNGYYEDFYPLRNKILQGDWQYTKKIDFDLIKIPKKNLFNALIKNPDIIREDYVVAPASPIFPLSYKNIAFLGDSFGNATTSSAEGIRVILDSSKILIDAIKKKDLKNYEKEWKKKYLEVFIKFLSSKLNDYNNPEFIDRIKNPPSKKEMASIFSKYPETFEKIIMCEKDISIPREIKDKYSYSYRLFQLYHYLQLKLLYLLM